MFLSIRGECHHVVLQQECGCWLVSYQKPGEPFFISDTEIQQYERVPAPDDYVKGGKQMEGGFLTMAQRERFEMIFPLLEDDQCIYDRRHRSELLAQQAARYQTTAKRVRNAYFTFLGTGRISKQYKRQGCTDGKYTDDFIWAIRTVYFSASRVSLRDAYDAMLLSRFMTLDGRLADDVPSFNSFRKFFYSRKFHKRSQKSISRGGLTNYQRNLRPLSGAAMKWRNQIGSYQMDATEADIYLVSRFDRSVIGRPYIYMAVDTSTQLIAGIYVGLDAGDSAVMACLQNAAEDKVKFCARYGIKIDPWQWPSHGLPYEVISDKGREFFGKRMDELCMRYSMEIQSLPPFRPDGKGLVEKSFDLLQQRYKPLLRGKGVIEDDAQERWATDYRTQAVLTLDDYIKVCIHSILYLNSARVLASFKPSAEMVKANVDYIPARIWEWMTGIGQNGLMEVDAHELYLQSLPREQAVLSRRGIACSGLYYTCRDFERNGIYIGDTVECVHDPSDTSKVYIVLPDSYLEVPIAPAVEQYAGLSFFEYELFAGQKQEKIAGLKRQEVEGRVKALREIKKVIDQAGPPAAKKTAGETIKKNREKERGRRS